MSFLDLAVDNVILPTTVAAPFLLCHGQCVEVWKGVLGEGRHLLCSVLWFWRGRPANFWASVNLPKPSSGHRKIGKTWCEKFQFVGSGEIQNDFLVNILKDNQSVALF